MKIEQGKITITFSDGMIIELTQEEFDELKIYFKEVIYIPSMPYTPNPVQPYQPYPTSPIVVWHKIAETDNTVTLKEE